MSRLPFPKKTVPATSRVAVPITPPNRLPLRPFCLLFFRKSPHSPENPSQESISRTPNRTPAHLPLTLSQKHLHSSEPKETPVRLIVGTRDTEKTAEEGEGPVVVCLMGDQ